MDTDNGYSMASHRVLWLADFISALLQGALPHLADPITDAENWFNQIKTMKARFIQVSDDGSLCRRRFLFKTSILVTL